MKKYSTIIILVILLCFVLFYCSQMQKNEYFKDISFDVARCGTAGIKPSSQAIKFINDTKALGPNLPSDISAMRLYTKSECDKLDGGKIDPNFPFACGGDGVSYSLTCGSLNNTVKSLPPNECKIDGVYAGKPNEPYTMIRDGKEVIIEKNTFQVYTKNECTLLNKDAFFIPFADNADKKLAAKAVMANGEGYGGCLHKDMNYSLLCTVDEPPSLTGDIKSAAKKHITDWLK